MEAKVTGQIELRLAGEAGAELMTALPLEPGKVVWRGCSTRAVIRLAGS